ncbi:MAG: PEP-CTERM sorting domain-containing protein [Verrucomicrobia bacterium]|nr:PEP-CTERM sorting domain-containing protein [Verrucomicrobiota bacterium]
MAFSTPRRSDAQVFTFNSGAPDGLMATASRPGVGGKIEIESADDFLLSSQTRITTATFTGLLTGVNPTVNSVDVEIYRIFPLDSTTPPSGNVPTRTNSPSDNVFAVRDSTLSNSLTFTQTTLSASFTASNSVLNGINKIPNQMTGGEGAVTGVEVQFNLTFPTFLDLPADHYFFIPQVSVTNGEFYWLSTAKPISGAGTTPFVPDLQEWIRNANLDPDWLRVGTDIVGGVTPPTFNDSFSLSGTVVPEPSTWVTMIVGWGALVGAARLRRQRAARG